jgi:acyl carrier protein
MKMIVDEILKNFIFEELARDIKINTWSNGDSLLEKGIIDSVNMGEILAFIEEKFRIKIKDEELIPENFETINSICNLIEGKLPNNSLNINF